MITKVLASLIAVSLGSSGLLFALSLREQQRVRSEILATPDAIDLGEVDQGKTASFVFKVKNTTSDAVTVVGLFPSCGCTWLDDVKGSSIAPDDMLSIRGTLNTEGRRGPMNSHAVLSYRTPKSEAKGDLILTVRAVVRPTLRLTPESFDIDLVAGSREKITRMVAIDSDRLDSFSIHDPESSASWIAIEIVERVFRKDGTSPQFARLRITIDPTITSPDYWPSTAIKESARVRTTSEAEPNLVIPIRIRKP